ncbi:MAG TPA: response regulator transcription factor [Syntrophorhabdaceae bacterium]|jgi:DNA-binding NarL/FixJ family response regulator
MFRFAIVDDHPIVRIGLKEIILESFYGATIDEFAAGYELIWNARKNRYDIALLGIDLPDISGIEVLEEIKKKNTKLPVLIVSMHPEEDYATRALRAGAYGYVSKQSATEELLEAMRKVLSGKKYVSPAFADKMLSDFETGAEQAPHDKLSVRELQVLVMIGRGKTVNQMAEGFHLSADTLRTCRAIILQKLGMKGISQLMHYAITRGLI